MQRQQFKPPYALVVGQVFLEVVDFLLKELSDSLVCNQLVIRIVSYTGPESKFFQNLKFRNDECGAVSSSIADKDELVDKLAVQEMAFDGLRRDVLSSGTHKQVLLPVGNHQVAFRIEPSDVTCMQPAILIDHFPGSLGILVVAKHNVRTLCENFAIGRDFEFNARNWFPHRSEPVVIKAVCGKNRRSFRQSVSFDNRDADRLKEFPEVLRKRRTA